jgi:plasmid stabilization system protein ParE
LELLQSFPRLAGKWRPPVRRAFIRRSHYGLFYVVEPSRLVIIALQDLRQDPERLQRDILRRLP